MSARALVLASCFCAATALADARFDHRGSVGLLLGGGLENKTQSPFDNGWRGDVDLGGTLAVGVNGNELLAIARGTFGGAAADWSLTAGYRGYFGYDRAKTFLDFDAVAHAQPRVFTAGPRVGFGVEYELTQTLGVYLALGGQIAFGANAIRFDAELLGGLQLRTYLLE